MDNFEAAAVVDVSIWQHSKQMQAAQLALDRRPRRMARNSIENSSMLEHLASKRSSAEDFVAQIRGAWEDLESLGQPHFEARLLRKVASIARQLFDVWPGQPRKHAQSKHGRLPLQTPRKTPRTRTSSLQLGGHIRTSEQSQAACLASLIRAVLLERV